MQCPVLGNQTFVRLSLKPVIGASSDDLSGFMRVSRLVFQRLGFRGLWSTAGFRVVGRLSPNPKLSLNPRPQTLNEYVWLFH